MEDVKSSDVKISTFAGEAVLFNGPASTDNDPVIRLSKRRWLILLIFSFISMMNEVIWISYGSISDIIAKYYDVTSEACDWLAMIFNVFYILAPLGIISLKKYGLKVTILIAAVLNAIASYFRIAGRNRNGFVFVLAGNGFAALAQCFVLFVPASLAAAWFSETERAKATSIGIQANILGIAVGFLMGGLLVPDTEDYDGAIKERIFLSLLGQTIVCTVLMFLSMVFLKDEPEYAPSMSQYLLKRKTERTPLKSLNHNDNGRKPESNDQSRFSEPKNEEKDAGIDNPAFNANNLADHKSKHDKYSVANVNEEKSNNHQLAFKETLSGIKTLCKNVPFHLLIQAFGLYSSGFLGYSVNLNLWVTLKFPNKEKEIGLMGFAGVMFGLIALPVVGILLDRTHRYKSISIFTISGAASALLIFTLLLNYTHNFVLVFISYCMVGFFSYAFVPVALEYAADLTYPISESITSTLLFLVGNIYGTAMIYVVEKIIEVGWGKAAGFVMVGAYSIGVVCVVFIKGKLRRSDADKGARQHSGLVKASKVDDLSVDAK